MRLLEGNDNDITTPPDASFQKFSVTRCQILCAT